MYYKGTYKCSDNVCGNVTRSLLVNSKCNVLGCKARVKPQVSEMAVNDTLRYLQSLFDVEKFCRENKDKTIDQIGHSSILLEVK
jgi:hypothetical protein